MTSPWIDFLARTGASIEDNSITYPALGDDSETQIVPLLHLGLIRTAGIDSIEFLHNLLSNDVRKLESDAVQWNSFNTPKGRMLASMLVFRESEGHGILVSADIREAIQKRLAMYVLRSKVVVTDGNQNTVIIGLHGGDPAATLRRAGLPVSDSDMTQTAADGVRSIRLRSNMHVVLVDSAYGPDIWKRLSDADAQPASTDSWQLAMIRAGLPLITAATQEEFVAQMLNYELIGGVSFNKGCYPGQEIVARTQYLGKLKKRMYRVLLPAGRQPRPGDDIFTPEFGDQSAGKLVNIAPTSGGSFEALAVMQTSCAAAGDAHAFAPDGPALTFLDLPYSLP